jgi:pimeloyl-ACP methyl ester carboxylesterase
MPQLEVAGQRIAFREAGAGRPPLLLVHGAGSGSSHFAGILGALGRSRRVVALDLPGHGRSPAFRAQVPPEELLLRYRDLCAELAERLGLGRFVLVGHSMGGAIGLLLATSYPDRLSGLVLLGSGARLSIAESLLSAAGGRFDELPVLLAGLGYSPASQRAQVRRWAAAATQAPREVVLADLHACGAVDLRPQLGGLRVPVSIIAGADDRITPLASQERLRLAIPGAGFWPISRAGHFLVQERPDAVVEALLRSVVH